MASVKQTPLSCSGHTRPVVDLSFSQVTPYGYFLISACKDGKPMLRQGDTGDWIGTFLGHKGAVWGATLSRDGERAATGAADFTAKVWSAVTGDEIYSFTHRHIVKTVDFSEDGSRLLTGSNEKLMRIFDLNHPESEPQVISGHTSSIRDALWCQKGKTIISAAEDKTVRMWDVASNREIMKIDLDSSNLNLDINNDGSILVITHGKSISFYKTDSLEKLKSYEAPTPVYSASLHPEKLCFVAGGEDFKIYKFDYETGQELESYKGHFGPVHCVRFSPDGELYSSGSEDGTLRLWQTSVGKTYGLWRCVLPGEDITNSSSQAIKTDA
ncbi:serine-threonine kinase receptor-associated protein-like [Saccoglossus kowalevskii]|uniref:Serine-threonine kinase receptor-associated protein n=1 Tax=Saccoglossus kowalevskii TaxID=10224 RepID=A0ABM0GKP8_SACKO|nr:PREDICTED: serine-threonine kinase receptor-associated protein-like [Saccoglossus kowalevskii]